MFARTTWQLDGSDSDWRAGASFGRSPGPLQIWEVHLTGTMKTLGFLVLSSMMGWLAQLGGFGLILMGLADNSVVPMPGSMDVLTIWLAASNPHLWYYYAFMSLLGSLLGGYLTYYLSRKGGKEALERKLPKKRAAKVCRRFERWGFWAVAVPAVLPPPFPIVPFLIAAGALQYGRRKFLGALALGRGIRFTIIAGLGVYYGRQVLAFFSRYYKPAVAVLVAFSVIGGVLALRQYYQYRRSTAGPTASGQPSRQAA